ncbi:MAG TPA: sigma-70 family RNA polymerase sigma factor [Polyangia bacterium]|jgi:RNA polymerase sigma-70 factor (ECF subfamily)
MESRADDDLMLLARGGVTAAFDTLVRRHQQRVLRVAFKYLGIAAPVRDVAQNAFLEVYRALPHYEPRGRFASFLYRVLLNQCRIEVRRRRSHDEAVRASYEEPAPPPRSDDEVLAGERRREVERAVARLSPKLRDVVVLRFGADLSHPEIAEALHIPVGTAKRRLFDALEKLSALLERP